MPRTMYENASGRGSRHVEAQAAYKPTSRLLSGSQDELIQLSYATYLIVTNNMACLLEELGKHGRDNMSEALHEDKTGYKVG